MRTIVVNNQKGGVGKTTLALHLAWHYVEQDKRVLFVDLDAQGNATATLARPTPEQPRWQAHGCGLAADLFSPARLEIDPAPPFQLLAASSRLNMVDAALEVALDAIRARHDGLSPLFDLCIIDTPPAFGARNLGALIVCDHLIAPIQLEDYALRGVNDLLKSIAVAEKLRGGRLDFLGLLPSQFRANSSLHRQNLETLVRDLGRAELLFPAFLALRQGYVEAVGRGLPVWMIRDNSAAAVAGREMRHVLELVANRVALRS